MAKTPSMVASGLAAQRYSDPLNRYRDAIWQTAKYIGWPYSQQNPIVRIPTPSGRPDSKSFRREPGETCEALFKRCLAYRDTEGPKIWGEKRWRELLNVQARSVTRHHSTPAGPITGVFHYEHPGGTNSWIATWYELRPDGTRRKRSKVYSYGKPTSQYATSAQAMLAAINRRITEEARWYSTVGQGNSRQACRLD